MESLGGSFFVKKYLMMQLKNKTEVACLYQTGNAKELKSEILLTKRPIHQNNMMNSSNDVKLIKIEYEIMLIICYEFICNVIIRDNAK